MVELKKIKKYFSANGVKALDGADFDLREGEIHALLGENGAGKSTLMHIMAGFLKPGVEGIGRPRGAGTILVNGVEQHFASPAQALSSGIGMIRQHPHQFPGFLVWENCTVGSRKHPPFFFKRRLFRQQAADLNERFGFGLPLDSPTESLNVSQGQKAAILTLLLRDVRYLVFDEPTAVLSPGETEQLFSLFRKLRDEGRGIVLISHKLDETIKLADRVTILRRGKTRICSAACELDNNALWEHIFGAESLRPITVPPLSTITGLGTVTNFGSVKTSIARIVLSLKDFTVEVSGRPIVRGINLELERGKIMGIGGVRDSGLETLELALTGFLPASGSLKLNGTELLGGYGGTDPSVSRGAVKRIQAFRNAGGAYLGTRNEGEDLPVRDMLLLHAHRRFQSRGILSRKKIDLWIDSMMTLAKVPPRDRAAGTAFSGGQLQRLLLTREMAEKCSLLVLSDPGRGLDRRYRKKLGALLREKTGDGTAVLIFSTDVEEMLSLADSIIVLRNGVVSAAAALAGQTALPELQNRIQEAMV